MCNIYIHVLYTYTTMHGTELLYAENAAVFEIKDVWTRGEMRTTVYTSVNRNPVHRYIVCGYACMNVYMRIIYIYARVAEKNNLNRKAWRKSSVSRALSRYRVGRRAYNPLVRRANRKEMEKKKNSERHTFSAIFGVRAKNRAKKKIAIIRLFKCH